MGVIYDGEEGGDLKRQGTACAPNFGAAGRRRRERSTRLAAAFAIVAFALAAFLPLPWPARLIAAGLTGVYWANRLQLRYNTCLVRAAQGVVENEDFGTEAAPTADAAASRRAARSILLQSLLYGIIAAAGIELLVALQNRL